MELKVGEPKYQKDFLTERKVADRHISGSSLLVDERDINNSKMKLVLMIEGPAAQHTVAIIATKPHFSSEKRNYERDMRPSLSALKIALGRLSSPKIAIYGEGYEDSYPYKSAKNPVQYEDYRRVQELDERQLGALGALVFREKIRITEDKLTLKLQRNVEIPEVNGNEVFKKREFQYTMEIDAQGKDFTPLLALFERRPVAL
ncbi:MAG: hypothetical protein KGH61_05460 [Candidatus Micrarchaeota archaeon]|nr:hypothetical protein [Candidatus Micrarchaeota archaeon]MDE1848361.1 hypothetical protein [Candidatus Micrarchaeota archaeon]MDE1864580.1 hypothetical protein [Candidatus Micrarchaeota archaeon]